MGANGFSLPSFPVGISKILELCKLTKAVSEKMESSSFMLLTLNNTERKFSEREEFWFNIFVLGTIVFEEEEIKFCFSGVFSIKKI